MSLREEDRQRNCPSRGLGIAAAAIGVGVGAALYYFFNKRTEQPDESGSTSNWTCEEPQTLDPIRRRINFTEDSNMSIDFEQNISIDMDLNTGIHTDSDTNSDTSIDTDSDISIPNISFEISYSDIDDEETEEDSSLSDMFDDLNFTPINTSSDSYETVSVNTTSDTSIISLSSQDEFGADGEADYNSRPIVTSPVSVSPPIIVRGNTVTISLGQGYPTSIWARTRTIQLNPELQRLAKLREQKFRERSWTLEECSICFESMHREQEVMALACSHRFHQPCILPWLQERQTCPNCRKDA